MQIITYKKIENNEYDYAIKFNRTRRTIKFFNEFAQILAHPSKKTYDAQNKCWLVTSTCFEEFEALEKKIFPNKNNKLKNIIKISSEDFNVVQDFTNIGHMMKLQPFDYQKKAIKLALDKQNAIIIGGCGCGKTPIGIGIYLEARLQNIVSNQGMIVAKASLKKQWLMEIKKFSNLKAQIVYTRAESINIKKSIIRNKNKLLKKELDIEKQNIIKNELDVLNNTDFFEHQFENDIDLFILNYETLLNNEIVTKLESIKLDFVYADEIHYIKNDTSKRAEALCKFNNVKLKYGATATPIQRDPRDIYSLFKFINPNVFPSKSQFNRFYIKWGGYGRPIGAINEENLNQKISPYMIIIPQEEIGAQLPEVVVLQKYCELTPEQQEINNKLLSELEELHEKEKVLQQNPEENKEELAKIEANIMMRQTFAQELADSEELLSLSDSLSAKNYISNTESNKMNLLIDLLEEILNSGEKVCIFSRFTKMQDIITNRISKEKSNIFKDIEIAYINGSLNTNARYDEVYNKFRDNENCKILCCSDAGAEGINLSWCRYVIEVDLANSYAIQQQRHGRVKRADSTHKTVFVYQLICENSYDEIAQKIVNKKEYYDKTIINGIKIE